MSSLSGRRIVVGVCGGIAAYKAAELVRALIKAGAQVRVVMTRAAQEFITPLTLQTLSQHRVTTELFDLESESSRPSLSPDGARKSEATVGHIGIADFAELFLIAPATADVIAKLAHGHADDVLTTVALATHARVLIAPAMNVNMWNHAAVQHNVSTLTARGAMFVGPEAGELACGWVGAGRLIELAAIVAAAESVLTAAIPVDDLAGARIVVTAGGTHEAIDSVRFLGNRSSGKMGFAIAERAAARGASVCLIAAPTALPTPANVDRINVTSAAEMLAAVDNTYADADTIVMAAAVADFRPVHVLDGKWKKSDAGASPTLALERTPDILAGLGARRGDAVHPILVGFAAETQNVESEAARKREQKRCDLVVGNDVSEAGSGFGTDTNRAVFADADGAHWLPQLSKHGLADRILDRVITLRKKP